MSQKLSVVSKHVGFEEDENLNKNIFEIGQVEGAESSSDENDTQEDMSDSEDY